MGRRIHRQLGANTLLECNKALLNNTRPGVNATVQGTQARRLRMYLAMVVAELRGLGEASRIGGSSLVVRKFACSHEETAQQRKMRRNS